MSQIIATVRKDLAILRRDQGTLLILFLMPLVFILVMSLAFSNVGAPAEGTAATLLVVNESGDSLGALLITALAGQYSGTIQTSRGDAALTRANAEALLRAGQAGAAVIIPDDFSSGTATSVGTATITLLVDPALPPQSGGAFRAALSVALQEVLYPSITIVESSPSGMEARVAGSAVERNVPAYTLFGVFFIVQYLAASILDERRLGTLQRILVTPTSGRTMMAGKLLSALLVNLAQIVVMFAAGMFLLPLFGLSSLRLDTNPLGIVLVSVAASISAGSLGLLLAAVVRNYDQISGLGLMIVLPLAILGGVMVPREQLPPLMRDLGLLSPHTWALDAYTALLAGGADIVAILPNIAFLGLFAAICYASAVLLFQRNTRTIV